MKVTIKLRNQDKPVIIDNVQVTQQRAPMYLVALGETRYRFSLDLIDQITEEGVVSNPTNIVSTTEVKVDGTPEPKVTSGKPKAKTHKVIRIDLSQLEGKLNLWDNNPHNNKDGFSKGEIAKRVGEVLKIGQTRSYQIVNQLIEEGKIRRVRGCKGNILTNRYDVADPTLNPSLVEIWAWEKEDGETLEESINKGFE